MLSSPPVTEEMEMCQTPWYLSRALSTACQSVPADICQQNTSDLDNEAKPQSSHFITGAFCQWSALKVLHKNGSCYNERRDTKNDCGIVVKEAIYGVPWILVDLIELGLKFWNDNSLTCSSLQLGN